jgi:hypothetical protein
MRSVFLARMMRFMILLFVQILIVNHIHLGGYAMPLIIGYIVVRFHFGSSRIGLLLWGFFAGMVYDIFTDTMGICMASMTLLSMVQPALLRMFKPRDAADDFIPNIKNMGGWLFFAYLTLSMLVLHASFYLLAAFSLANWTLTLTAIMLGTSVSSVVVFFVEVMLNSVKHE